MKIHAAHVKEQNVRFGILEVTYTAFNNTRLSNKVRELGLRMFGDIPIILANHNSNGGVRYSGRKDIVNFLANTPSHCIPWREYTIGW